MGEGVARKPCMTARLILICALLVVLTATVTAAVVLGGSSAELAALQTTKTKLEIQLLRRELSPADCTRWAESQPGYGGNAVDNILHRDSLIRECMGEPRE